MPYIWLFRGPVRNFQRFIVVSLTRISISGIHYAMVSLSHMKTVTLRVSVFFFFLTHRKAQWHLFKLPTKDKKVDCQFWCFKDVYLFITYGKINPLQVRITFFLNQCLFLKPFWVSPLMSSGVVTCKKSSLLPSYCVPLMLGEGHGDIYILILWDWNMEGVNHAEIFFKVSLEACWVNQKLFLTSFSSCFLKPGNCKYLFWE